MGLGEGLYRKRWVPDVEIWRGHGANVVGAWITSFKWELTLCKIAREGRMGSMKERDKSLSAFFDFVLKNLMKQESRWNLWMW